jgi:hypothetical protein
VTDTDGTVVVTFSPQQGQSRSNYLVPITTCEIYDVCYDPHGSADQCPDGGCTVDCEYYVYTEQICTTVWINIGGGGGPGGGEPGGEPGGGGGGGGGSGGGWNPPTCGGGTGRYFVINPCGPGWIPPVLDEPPVNSLGYYYSRINTLTNELLNNPYFLIDPCNYLTQFHWLGNHQVPQIVLNRLDSINQVFINQFPGGLQNFLQSPYYVQNLNNAAGTVVNCDYFVLTP